MLTRFGGGSVAEGQKSAPAFTGFGAPMTGGIFGATPAAAPSTGSLFGVTPSAAPAFAPAAASLFAAPAGGGSLFGNTGGMGGIGVAAPAATGGLFGASAPASASMFAVPAASTGGGGVFGSLGGIGGTGVAAPAATGGLFGAPAATGGLFGAPAATGSLFGAAPSTGSLFGVTPAAASASAPAAGGLFVTAASAGVPSATDYLPRRTPRPLSQTDFLKEFLGPIEDLIETKLAQKKMQSNDAKEITELQKQLRDQSLRFRNGSQINMSEALYLHQEHVNQCKSILKYCGAQEQQNKEEENLKTSLDADFEK